MNKKEKVPLVIHKAIQPFLDKSDSLFQKDNPESDLLRFKGLKKMCKFESGLTNKKCKLF